jgi:hypothetical protein
MSAEGSGGQQDSRGSERAFRLEGTDLITQITSQDKSVALVSGANQGIGLQIAKDLVAHSFTVLVGSRNFERGEAAAKEIAPDAH